MQDSLWKLLMGGIIVLTVSYVVFFFEGSSGVYERGIPWPDDILSLIKI